MNGDAFDARMAEAAETLKSVYVELPNYELVLGNIIKHGMAGLRSRCHITAGAVSMALLFCYVAVLWFEEGSV